MEQPEPDAIAAAMRDGVRIALLGGFRVAAGSRIILPSDWRLRKAGHLVKLLALSPQHRMHREQVLDTLWPHLDFDAAGNNLRVTLHFARKLLDTEQHGNRTLHVSGDQVILFPDGPIAVDVAEFEAAATTALATNHLSAHLAALDLYAGELLPEDRFEPWAIERREALHTTRLTLLRNVARLYEDAGDVERAIAALHEAFAGDPINEPVCVGLMRLYAQTGRRALALRQYLQLREALQREMDIEPEPSTTRLYQNLMAGSPDIDVQPAAVVTEAATARRPPGPTVIEPQTRTNLPAQLTSFIGRETQLQRLVDAANGSRLITLTGPGGSGKTRLAIEVATRLLDTFEDGVWIVDLAGLSDAALVPQTVASTLNVPEAEGRPAIDTLSEALAGKRMLLILDNCEHLIEAAAALASRLLVACSRLQLLATSREPLRVAGEQVWPVPALDVPRLEPLPDLNELATVESVRLFLDRARLASADLTLTPANAVAIATICERLDGLPLAIELAAARVRTLPVNQLVARLDAALPLLTGGSRTGPTRHHSIQATIAWSYDLLSEPEQLMLARLSVFADGFTLEAAEAICADDRVPHGRVIELLFQLVDKSLVVVGDLNDAVRYWLLETVRQFAHDLLDASEERDAIRRRFRDWYRALAERSELEMLGPGNIAGRLRLMAEIDNLRSALETGQHEDSLEDVLRLATALWPFWVQSPSPSEGRGWLEHLLAHDDIASVPDILRARAMLALAVITQRQGDFRQSIHRTEAALELWNALGDPIGIALAYNNLCTCVLMQNNYSRAIDICSESLSRSQAVNLGAGITASLGSLGEAELMQGNLTRGRELLQQAEAMARELQFAPFMTWMQASLGEVARLEGDIETARACLLDSLEIGRTIHDGLGISRALRGLGLLSLEAGDAEESAELLAQSLEAVWTLGFKSEIARALETLARIAIARDDATSAVQMLATARALRDAIDCPVAPLERPTIASIESTARNLLGDAVFARAWSTGRSLPLSRAIADALSSQRPTLKH